MQLNMNFRHSNWSTNCSTFLNNNVTEALIIVLTWFFMMNLTNLNFMNGPSKNGFLLGFSLWNLKIPANRVFLIGFFCFVV